MSRSSGHTGSAQGGPSRAVSRNRNFGNPALFRVQADRLDDEIEFIGAVDLARHAVGHIGPDELGFGGVIEPVNPLRVAVLHEEHGIRQIFRPRDVLSFFRTRVDRTPGVRSAASVWSHGCVPEGFTGHEYSEEDGLLG